MDATFGFRIEETLARKTFCFPEAHERAGRGPHAKHCWCCHWKISRGLTQTSHCSHCIFGRRSLLSCISPETIEALIRKSSETVTKVRTSNDYLEAAKQIVVWTSLKQRTEHRKRSLLELAMARPLLPWYPHTAGKAEHIATIDYCMHIQPTILRPCQRASCRLRSRQRMGLYTVHIFSKCVNNLQLFRRVGYCGDSIGKAKIQAP
jgi:hypothetical protein